MRANCWMGKQKVRVENVPDPTILNACGSLFLTRPSLAHHLASREELLWRVGDVMTLVASDALKVRVSAAYDLADATLAFRNLEGRTSTGKLVLTVRP